MHMPDRVHKPKFSEIDYDATMSSSRIKTSFYELYDEYIRVYGPSLNIDVPQTQNVSHSLSSAGLMSLGYFSILAIIAKQIRSTPISTVVVEQEFSARGNILDTKLSLFNLESIQIQACIDDWTKAQNRQQEIDQDAPYDFFDDGQHTLMAGTDGSD
ncbi:hypothetical protein Dsin_005771 [Dipteronia sinensis]|uniref:HAT C-terminal dimerisation domain-containing protein n=1 Tax=Dipteronia sinensis TaxID=43782 RepID=A0AAE0EF82_9ROSI|nr:hypothetical protein Dsin_005771 [Dipteronia sinensis]